MYRLVVYPKVRAALFEAVAWNVEHGSRDFGEQLVDTVEAAFLEIAERPMMWPVAKRFPALRVRHLRTIRYTIFYRVSADVVRIIGLAHMRRSPDSWNRR